jgi:hypothetical protein
MYTRLGKEGKNKETERSDSCPLEKIVERRIKTFEEK